MNGVPGALQNRDPACRARQVNSRHIARCAATRLHGACGRTRSAGQLPPFFAISTILTCIFTNGFTNEIFQYVYAYNTIFKILYCHF